MSDRRRQIAERLIGRCGVCNGTRLVELTQYDAASNATENCGFDKCRSCEGQLAKFEKCLSEYAAALLEEMAAKIDDPQTCEQNVVKWLLRRAAQERAR